MRLHQPSAPIRPSIGAMVHDVLTSIRDEFDATIPAFNHRHDPIPAIVEPCYAANKGAIIADAGGERWRIRDAVRGHWRRRAPVS